MRQVMPHRNNMSLHRNKCKIFLRRRGAIAGAVTILQQTGQTTGSVRTNIYMRNNGLHMLQLPDGVRPLTCWNG